LAQLLDGEIVNVDSVQVFKGLDIGSAKLKTSQRCGVPHHVLDIFSPDESANVAKFRQQALTAIDGIRAGGKLPILVGGSGLYLTALLHGLADVPATPSELRQAIAAMAPGEQYAELQRVDPVTAMRLNPNDTQRVSRALEIFRITGKPASEFFAEHTFAQLDVVSLVIVICRPRDELYHRIDLRAAQMLEDGLVAETDQLLKRYGRLPALETLGYKQACDYLEGKLKEGEVAREIALHTRRFAKRQMTYWRNEPAKRGWIVSPSEEHDAGLVAGFDDFPVRAQKRMKGFRAYLWSKEELINRIRVRLSQPLERSEVWFWQGV
jgi:tRNA dimethylallyltransferase